ncbi:MAG: hypothetical protein ABI175_18090, partial [Polyangiales bacterium]
RILDAKCPQFRRFRYIVIPVITGILIALAVFALRQTYARSVPEKRHGLKETPEPPDPVTLLPIYQGLASAPENAPIKLVGVVRAGAASFTSALGGEPCVACLVGATVWHSKKVPQVVANLRDATAAPFTLVLSDGEIEVEGVSAVECPTRKVKRHPERERVVLARHKLERHAESTDFTEGRIVDGDRITVIGTLVRQASGEQGYRDQVKPLRIASTPAQPVMLVKAKK